MIEVDLETPEMVEQAALVMVKLMVDVKKNWAKDVEWSLEYQLVNHPAEFDLKYQTEINQIILRRHGVAAAQEQWGKFQFFWYRSGNIAVCPYCNQVDVKNRTLHARDCMVTSQSMVKKAFCSLCRVASHPDYPKAHLFSEIHWSKTHQCLQINENGVTQIADYRDTTVASKTILPTYVYGIKKILENLDYAPTSMFHLIRGHTQIDYANNRRLPMMLNMEANAGRFANGKWLPGCQICERTLFRHHPVHFTAVVHATVQAQRTTSMLPCGHTVVTISRDMLPDGVNVWDKIKNRMAKSKSLKMPAVNKTTFNRRFFPEDDHKTRDPDVRFYTHHRMIDADQSLVDQMSALEGQYNHRQVRTPAESNPFDMDDLVAEMLGIAHQMDKTNASEQEEASMSAEMERLNPEDVVVISSVEITIKINQANVHLHQKSQDDSTAILEIPDDVAEITLDTVIDIVDKYAPRVIPMLTSQLKAETIMPFGKAASTNVAPYPLGLFHRVIKDGYRKAVKQLRPPQVVPRDNRTTLLKIPMGQKGLVDMVRKCQIMGKGNCVVMKKSGREDKENRTAGAYKIRVKIPTIGKYAQFLSASPLRPPIRAIMLNDLINTHVHIRTLASAMNDSECVTDSRKTLLRKRCSDRVIIIPNSPYKHPDIRKKPWVMNLDTISEETPARPGLKRPRRVRDIT